MELFNSKQFPTLTASRNETGLLTFSSLPVLTLDFSILVPFIQRPHRIDVTYLHLKKYHVNVDFVPAKKPKYNEINQLLFDLILKHLILDNKVVEILFSTTNKCNVTLFVLLHKEAHQNTDQNIVFDLSFSSQETAAGAFLLFSKLIHSTNDLEAQNEFVFNTTQLKLQCARKEFNLLFQLFENADDNIEPIAPIAPIALITYELNFEDYLKWQSVSEDISTLKLLWPTSKNFAQQQHFVYADVHLDDVKKIGSHRTNSVKPIEPIQQLLLNLMSKIPTDDDIINGLKNQMQSPTDVNVWLSVGEETVYFNDFSLKPSTLNFMQRAFDNTVATLKNSLKLFYSSQPNTYIWINDSPFKVQGLISENVMLGGKLHVSFKFFNNEEISDHIVFENASDFKLAFHLLSRKLGEFNDSFLPPSDLISNEASRFEYSQKTCLFIGKTEYEQIFVSLGNSFVMSIIEGKNEMLYDYYKKNHAYVMYPVSKNVLTDYPISFKNIKIYYNFAVEQIDK